MKGVIEQLANGVKMFAAIAVTYPAGSTLTCTNGTKTLTAETTDGKHIFAIPETGTWTVTATDGTNTKSQSVSITTEGQLESVTLSYQLILFDGGDNTDVTGGWDYDGRETEPIVTDKLGLDIDDEVTKANDDNYWILATVNSLDLSGYTKLCANITSASIWNSACLCVANSVAWDTTLKAEQSIDGTGKVELDISSVSSGHVGLYLTIISNGYAQLISSVYADKIWLE